MTMTPDQPVARRRPEPHRFVNETRERIAREEGPNARPPSASIAHVNYTAPDLDAAEAFWRKIGLRYLLRTPQSVIFEMAGGTHLIAFKGPADGDRLAFQLMVDDIEAMRGRLAQAGLEPTEILFGDVHDRFTVTEPGGRLVHVLDSHAIGVV